MGFAFHEHGVPTVDEAVCSGCGLCVGTCPDEVLEQGPGGKPHAGHGVFLGCIACGHCVAVCPTGAIRVSGHGMTPDDRLELPPRDARATADATESLLTARRSIRRFRPDEVPRDALERIVRMASTAPMGIPPHEVGVVVFPTREKVRAFSREACDEFARMHRFLNPVVLGLMRPFIGKYQYAAFRDFIRPLLKMLADGRKQGRDDFTYDAPAALLFHYGPESDGADTHIAATYAMLMAESLSLGSCMLGTTAGLSHDKQFKQKYGVPPKNKFGLGLVLGHPQEVFQRGIRRRLASVRFA